MNEAETRAELIDPRLQACGWGVVAGSKILREYPITAGKIQSGGGKARRMIADYVLVYKGVKLAVIEAKSDEQSVGEGVAQAKQYAEKLALETTYATNGKAIYGICLKTGAEGPVADYLTPEVLWAKTYPLQTATAAHPGVRTTAAWREALAEVPFEDKSGSWQLRYYQEIAVRNVSEAIATGRTRILLTLATGTGKTAIAFQIAWKLFQTRWNLKRDGSRRPRILFLADRNILADQAFNSFSAFPEGALVRIKPHEIRKGGRVPTNGSIFFTIFQTFMSGTDASGESAGSPAAGSPAAPYFGEYPADFIVIDECHRGGANDESNWRGILDYFAPAVQLGLTATPKRHDNVDTYRYFGELPNLFKSEAELRTLWSNPLTRRTLLEKLDAAGFGKEELTTLQKLIEADHSDLFDVLEYVFDSENKPITRAARVAVAEATIFALLNDQQREFIAFVLSKYVETGVEELDQEKLPLLLTNKYQSLEDARARLGDVSAISRLFIEFQQHLYKEKAA